MIPAVLWLLMMASASPEGYAQVQFFLHSPLAMPLVFLVFWAFWHHLLAGIRFLLLDIERGTDKASSLKTAAAVLLLAVFAALTSTTAWYIG
jgi:succinate dehydrogenase / fumarate reductase cytochrome b subunit